MPDDSEYTNTNVLTEPTIDAWSFKGKVGKNCDWVKKKPKQRCHLQDKKRKWKTVCSICPLTCIDAGFDIDDCIPSRKISDLRFNKVPPVDTLRSKWIRTSPHYEAGVHTKIYPLMPSDYPIGLAPKSTQKIVRYETKADSVVLYTDYEYDVSVGKIVAAENNRLLFPGDEGFWEEMEHVVDMQIMRRNNEDPSMHQTWPKIWQDGKHGYGNLSLATIADAVRGEYPAFHQQNLLSALWTEGIAMLPYAPMRSEVDFVGFQVRLAYINSWAFYAVAPINFYLKWAIGMPRPEEVAYLIARGEYTPKRGGVPESLYNKIVGMELESATDFTAYTDRPKKGCPMHPSWPAMHSAGSTISTWLPAIARLSGDQYCEALRTDYAVAMGRTVAGVHFHQDNTAGLNIGRGIVGAELPEFLEQEFGYDASTIAGRLEMLAFDWNTFDSKECTIDGVPAADHLARLDEMM